MCCCERFHLLLLQVTEGTTASCTHLASPASNEVVHRAKMDCASAGTEEQVGCWLCGQTAAGKISGLAILPARGCPGESTGRHNPQVRRLQRAIPGTKIARATVWAQAAIRVPDLAISLRERPGLGWGTSTRGFSAARRQVTDPVTAPTSACRHLRCGRACAQTRDRQPSAHDGAKNVPRKYR